MRIIQPHIYLCSQSPRRRELLKQIGIHFEVLLLRNDSGRGIEVDETPLPDELPLIYAERICREKARAGAQALTMRNLPEFPVLAADTIVTLDQRIFGKPADAKHAEEMLVQLSGREHEVISMVGLALGDQIEVVRSISKVRFTALSASRIAAYLRTNEYADKAGGYGIQGHAAAFIESLQGSYSGVMGLPLFETVELLKRHGYPAP